MRDLLIAACLGILATIGLANAADNPPQKCAPGGSDADIIAACTAAIKAARDDATLARAYALRAGALVRTGQAAASLADYDEAIRLQPRWSAAYFLRGIALSEAKRYADAIHDFDRTLAIAPNTPDANFLRGSAYAKLGNSQQAIIDYSRAIELKPDDYWPYQKRAIIQVSIGKLDLALEDLDRVLAIAPDNVDALNNRCFVRGLADKALAEALADCDKAMKLKPQPEIRDSRGLVYLRMGEFKKAIEDFDAAIAQKPGAAETIYKRGLARLRAGETEAGYADIAEARAADTKVTDELAKYGLTP